MNCPLELSVPVPTYYTERETAPKVFDTSTVGGELFMSNAGIKHAYRIKEAASERGGFLMTKHSNEKTLGPSV